MSVLSTTIKADYLLWGEVEQVNRLGFDFAVLSGVLKDDAWRVESQKESF